MRLLIETRDPLSDHTIYIILCSEKNLYPQSSFSSTDRETLQYEEKHSHNWAIHKDLDVRKSQFHYPWTNLQWLILYLSTPPFGSHLLYFTEAWMAITTDQWVLQIRDSYTIQFQTLPPSHPLPRYHSNAWHLYEKTDHLNQVRCNRQSAQVYVGKGFYSQFPHPPTPPKMGLAFNSISQEPQQLHVEFCMLANSSYSCSRSHGMVHSP